MSLIKCEVSKITRGVSKQTLPSGTDYLFNNKKVLNYYQIAGAYTWFNYNERDGRREEAVKYRYNGGAGAFTVLVNEPDTAMYLLTTVTKISNEHVTQGQKNPRIDPPASKIYLRIDDIIRVEPWPDDSNFSLIFFEQSPFAVVVYRVPHTLDEIEGSASGSGSLS